MTQLVKPYTLYVFIAAVWGRLRRWSPRGHPWPRERPRGHILKSLVLASKPQVLKPLALASKPQVLENCPVLGSRTALIFEQLKFCWKTPEISRKICEHLFCFPHLDHRRRQREGGQRAPLNVISPMKNCDKKAYCFFSFSFFLAFFADSSITS